MNSVRHNLIAKIHIAQTELCMDDATYRGLLMRETGKNSCAKMTLKELECVFNALKKSGFQPKPAPQHGRRPKGSAECVALIGKVEALLADNGLHWNYAHSMAARMFGKARVQWLTAPQLHKLAAALQIYANRRAK